MANIYDSKKIKPRTVIKTDNDLICIRNVTNAVRNNLITKSKEYSDGEIDSREYMQYLFDNYVCDPNGEKFENDVNDMDVETLDYVIELVSEFMNGTNSKKK